MRPDALWSGKVIPNQGYFTSQSKLDKAMKKKKHVPMGDRADFEGMRAMADKAAKARDAAFEAESKEVMRKAVAERGLLDAFGNLKPEAHSPLTDTPLISTKDDRLKP